MSNTKASVVEKLVLGLITILRDIEAIDVGNFPKRLRKVAFQLPILRAALECVGSKEMKEDLLALIWPIRDTCKVKALRLEMMFRKAVPGAGFQGFEPYRLAVDELGDEYEVEILIEKLLDDLRPIAESGKVDVEIRTHFQTFLKAFEKPSSLLPSLPGEFSSTPISNYGSGTVSLNTGSGDFYNNSGAGYQFIADVQNFGSVFDVPNPAKLLAEERERCLRSLGFVNKDARQQDIATAHDKTCQWIFETREFQKWRDREDFQNHNGVLWVKGKPGAGKSTLMKHTWQHCHKLFKDYVTAAYFFNARGESLEKTNLGMLRSLTHQLLKQDPLLYERFLPCFRSKEEQKETWQWREAELKNFLLSEFGKPQSKPLLFLIDALDECRETEVREVVKFLETISIKAAANFVTLHICLSSRHYPNISIGKTIELIVEKKEEHDGDIRRYVHDNLTEGTLNMEQEILDRAAGVFMWVVLVVKMLNQAYDEGKVEARKQKLQEIPNDLGQVFESLLNKDSRDNNETIILLQWILFTKRGLRPEELYFAMLAETNAKNSGPKKQSEVTVEDMQRRIINSSRGLIEIRKGKDRTVQFIHETVNDFLLRTERLSNLTPELRSNPIGMSHSILAVCCMTYITTSLLSIREDRPQKDLNLSAHEIREYLPEYPFLEYASLHALRHSEEAQRRGIPQREFLLFLRLQKFELYMLVHGAFEQIRSHLYCSKDTIPLHTLSFHGHRNLVRTYLEEQVDLDAQGEPCGTALQAASLKGEKSIVRMLLDKGADLNIQCGEFNTALQAASLRGEVEVVRMLLEKGANVEAQGGLLGSALHAAVFQRRTEIVRMLLNKGADVNARAGVFGSVLQALVSNNNERIRTRKYVSCMAQTGTKEAEDMMRVVDLAYSHKVADMTKPAEIMQLLLQKEVDIHTPVGLGGTALQYASAAGETELVRILLEQGADVNARSWSHGTALEAAIDNRQWPVVMMLLERDALYGFVGNLIYMALLIQGGQLVWSASCMLVMDFYYGLLVLLLQILLLVCGDVRNLESPSSLRPQRAKTANNYLWAKDVDILPKFR